METRRSILKLAAAELPADRDIVLEAVKRNWQALEIAASDLQSDRSKSRTWIFKAKANAEASMNVREVPHGPAKSPHMYARCRASS